MKSTTKKPTESTPRLDLRLIRSNFPKIRVDSSQKAADFNRQFYGDDIELYESAFILLLNTTHETIGFAKVGQGGVTSTVIDPRIVAYYAVKHLASGVILAHNHPSGAAKASEPDIRITRKIKEGLSMLDTNLLDHIILTRDNYLSMADDCLI